MPSPVPTLKLDTEVRGPSVFQLDDGSGQLFQASTNLAQHNMALAFDSWEKQVKYASEVQGTKDAMNPSFQPEQLPTSNTVADEAYRSGAAAVYGVRLDYETRTSLSSLGQMSQNSADAAMMMDGYINATAQRLPEQMQKPYLNSAIQEKNRILQSKYEQQVQLQKQGIKDQTDLDRVTLLKDVQTGARPLSEALQTLQASYSAKVAGGVDTPAGAYKDYLKDVDDFTVAALVPHYSSGNLVERMNELANNQSLTPELKNKIASSAFQLGRERLQAQKDATELYDKSRERSFNTQVNDMILGLRNNNPMSPGAIDARTKELTSKGWNPSIARQQAIDDASMAYSQQRSMLRSLIRENADRLTPNAAQALLDLGESEANRPLTYDDPSIIFALNNIERQQGSVPTEVLNRYVGNGLSYESEAKYRTRADEKYQEVFKSTGWKEALRQVDVKFPEPTDSISLGGGIKISTPKSVGTGMPEDQTLEQRNAIIGRLTDVVVANPSLVTDPTRYKDWQDVIQQTFSTYGQAGVAKYTQDVKTKAEAVLGPWGGYEGFRNAYEHGRISDEDFRDIYVKNGGILREYESLRKEGKIQ